MSLPPLPTKRRRRAVGAALVPLLAAAALTAGALSPSSAAATADDAGTSTTGTTQTASDTAQTVTLDPSAGGRVFDGVGAISGGGGTSRLLIDYPAKQRNQILDYLFKPQYGAALDILKVEIGGDTHSSNGAEPSHMRTSDEVDCNRGYEWWLMEQAKKRNPDVTFYGLAWGAPGWFKGGYWSQDSMRYFINWLGCAQQHHLDISYLGGRNEREPNAAWFVQFRKELDAAGYGDVKLVAGDEAGYGVMDQLKADPAFMKAIDTIGIHYPCSALRCTPNADAIDSGKKIWASETGWDNYSTGALRLASELNHEYVDAKMTAFINWPLIYSWYPTVQYQNSGFMKANEPWSGAFDIGSSLWTVAQTTQFTEPGWTYLDSASTYLDGGGTTVALKAPGSHADWSTIAETTAATAPQTVRFQVDPSLSGTTVHAVSTVLENSTDSEWFTPEPDPVVKDGSFEVTLQPGRVYTFSTVDTTHKGDAVSPASAPMPYGSDDFQGYPKHSTPTYFSDMEGAFETADCAGNGGKCLRQVITEAPEAWMRTPYPITLYGDLTWTDYTVSTKVLLEQQAATAVAARVTNEYNSTKAPRTNTWTGYWFWIDDTGTWRLEAHMPQDRVSNGATTVLASGTLPAGFGVDRWHRVALSVDGDRLTPSVDGKALTTVVDDTYANGQTGLAVDDYAAVQYDDYAVVPH